MHRVGLERLSSSALATSAESFLPTVTKGDGKPSNNNGGSLMVLDGARGTAFEVMACIGIFRASPLAAVILSLCMASGRTICPVLLIFVTLPLIPCPRFEH